MILLYILVSGVLAFFLEVGINALNLISWRRSAGAHWTERARQLFPVRTAAVLGGWFIICNLAIASQLIRGHITSDWFAPALAAWMGVAAAGYQLERKIWPGLSFKSWFNQYFIYFIFFRVGIVMFIIAGVLMPAEMKWQAWVIAGVTLALILSMIFGLTIAMLRWLRFIRPAPSRVHEIAQGEAERVGAKLNRTWAHAGPNAQAFALLPMNDMLFSDTLLNHLSDQELVGICAHEAAHLTESRWIFVGRVVTGLMLYPLIFTRPACERFGLFGFLGLIALIVLLLILNRVIGRKMEKRADATAVQQSADPAVYARALERLYEVNQVPVVMRKRAGLPHPDLYDRMLSAGVTPAYERPKPPPRKAWTSVLLYFLLIGVVAALLTQNEGKINWFSKHSVPDASETIQLRSEDLTNTSRKANP
jgi:Zn-dependent protease with chaperone function